MVASTFKATLLLSVLAAFQLTGLALPSRRASAPYCTGYKGLDLNASAQNCAKFKFANTPGDSGCRRNGTRLELSDVQDFTPDGKNTRRELSPSTKIIMMIVNVFESGTKHIDYAGWYALGDNRGYTVGRAGFTTSDGDALSVVNAYGSIVGSDANPFAKYTEELRRLSLLGTCGGGGDITGLSGFPELWVRTSCTDKRFLQAQDDIAMQKYYDRAMYWAGQKGITTTLGKAIFYDTIIQHGEGTGLPYVSIDRIMGMTNNGNGVGAISEQQYLTDFMEIRGQMLCCFPDNVWPESASRIRELYDLLLAGNMELTPPIAITLFTKDVIDGTENLHHIPAEKCNV